MFRQIQHEPEDEFKVRYISGDYYNVFTHGKVYRAYTGRYKDDETGMVLTNRGIRIENNFGEFYVLPESVKNEFVRVDDDAKDWPHD